MFSASRISRKLFRKTTDKMDFDLELHQFLQDNDLEEEAPKFSFHQMTYEDLLKYENEEDIRQIGEDIGLNEDAQTRLVQGLNFRVLDNPFSPTSFPRKISENASKQCIICLEIVEKGWFGSPHCRMCGQWVCSQHGKKQFKKEKVCDRCYDIYEPFEHLTEGSVKVRNKNKKNDDEKYDKINEEIGNNEHNKQMIERFKIGKSLGGGTYGNVRAAFDGLKKREVAIKKIYSKYKESFFMEASLMKSCDNPYIVPVYALFYDDHLCEFCIVMELCSSSIKNKVCKCTDFDIMHIAHDVLSALVYLHNKNIIHRDIKPDNILLHSSGTYKVADFGIGKAVQQTMAKTAIGTSKYMAPEIEHCNYSNNINYDESVDVFAFGQTMFELLNGHTLNLKCAYSEKKNRKTTEIKTYFLQMAVEKCIKINPKLRSSAHSLLEAVKNKYLLPQMIKTWASNKIINESTMFRSVLQTFLRKFVANNWQKWTQFVENNPFYKFEHVVGTRIVKRFGMQFDVHHEVNALYNLLRVSSQTEEKENEILNSTKMRFVKISFKAYGKLNGDIKIQNIKKCATFGDNNTLFIDSQNKVYKNMKVPRQLSINVKITEIACGSGHCLLLAQNDRLWAFGSNEYGQCAQNGDFIKEPRLCTLLEESKVSKISTGDSHSAVICFDGFAYTFGSNIYGQCGVPKGTNTRFPQQLTVAAKHVACGGSHTLIISQSQKLFACGYNFNGQVGNGINKNVFTPTPINLPHDVIDADGGDIHSLCILQNGDAYSWGNGACGQLGYGKGTLFKYAPKKIESEYCKFIKCFCGYSHSALLDEEHNLYTFGDNRFGQLCQSDNENRFQPTKVPNVRVSDVVLGEDKTFLVVENESVVVKYSERDKIETNKMYDVYVKNEQLFGSNEDWIKIKKNAHVCEHKQNQDHNVDEKMDDID